MIPRERQFSAHEPEPRVAGLLPHGPQFAFLVKTPDSLDSIRKLISAAKDRSRLRPHILILPRREYNLIGRKLRSVRKQQTVALSICDFLPLLDLDVAADNQLARPNKYPPPRWKYFMNNPAPSQVFIRLDSRQNVFLW